MANKVKGISEKMSKKFLEKERQVGRMMATITTLFFLVFLATPLVRQVNLVKNWYNKNGLIKKYFWFTISQNCFRLMILR